MNKQALRKQFLELRKNLSPTRRQEAKELIESQLLPKLADFNLILSFASLENEIDLWALNEKLVKEGRLALPRLEDRLIRPYHVSNIEDLALSPYRIYEPHPNSSTPIDHRAIDCILVPGLCFDTHLHRLGFGQGHYDRFLANLPNIPRYGIGFTEQQVEKIPIEPHDFPLTELFLF